MKEKDEIPPRDWFYWVVFVLYLYFSVTLVRKFLAGENAFALVASAGTSLLAIALLFGWPFRRRGEPLSSMQPARATSVVTSIVGAILFVVGSVGMLATR